jgi:hypothetical protein
MFFMNKKNSLQDLKSLLHSIVPTINGAPHQDQFRIRDMWETIVGLHIAKKASPEGVRNGILYVNVESSVWMQELTFMKQQILDRIHQTCESSGVKDIRFKLGKIPQGMEDSDEDLLPRLSEEEQAKIEKQTAAIKDQEVRESLQSLYSTDLKNKKKRAPRL